MAQQSLIDKVASAIEDPNNVSFDQFLAHIRKYAENLEKVGVFHTTSAGLANEGNTPYLSISCADYEAGSFFDNRSSILLGSSAPINQFQITFKNDAIEIEDNGQGKLVMGQPVHIEMPSSFIEQYDEQSVTRVLNALMLSLLRNRASFARTQDTISLAEDKGIHYSHASKDPYGLTQSIIDMFRDEFGVALPPAGNLFKRILWAFDKTKPLAIGKDNAVPLLTAYSSFSKVARDFKQACEDLSEPVKTTGLNAAKKLSTAAQKLDDRYIYSDTKKGTKWLPKTPENLKMSRIFAHVSTDINRDGLISSKTSDAALEKYFTTLGAKIDSALEELEQQSASALDHRAHISAVVLDRL